MAALPLVERLIERFEERRPTVRVVVQEGNSYLVAKQVIEGRVTLGVVSVAPPDDVWSAPIAVGGVAIVVRASNPLTSLTLIQVREVFSGRVWRWSELGVEVPEDEIAVVSREEGSGTRLAFEALAMAGDGPSGDGCRPSLLLRSVEASRGTSGGDPGPCPGTPVTPMAVLMPGSRDVLDFVAAHPGAIGYVEQGYLALQEERSIQVRTLSIEDTPPAPEHLVDGSYHLVQPIYLIADREPTGAARQFVDFTLSPEGQAIVAQAYAPVRGREKP
jgi:phosphate transport system substrate-binding protein